MHCTFWLNSRVFVVARVVDSFLRYSFSVATRMAISM